MNTLASCNVTSPYGKQDVCAQFIIDDTAVPFVLNDIAAAGQNYVFSCWLRSDSEGSIIVGNTTFTCSADVWVKVSVKFTASSENLPIVFGEVGTYYIYRPQLEIGSIATDWTPAPEDVIQTVTDLSSQINLTADGLRAEFTKTTDILTDSVGAVNERIDKYKLIECNENGVTISNGANTLRLVLDNTGISFFKAGQTDPFGFWDGQNFLTGNIEVRVDERAQFGKFAFVPRRDGSLSFLKVK